MFIKSIALVFFFLVSGLCALSAFYCIMVADFAAYALLVLGMVGAAHTSQSIIEG